ncbi:WbqC family protein [Flagellimonas flava]|uniref:WbqC-like protein family protein n=1 Tax=Flagellimonas flava TaxID=570519 RepID=A0A1M5HW15_9FLAO|nr:WbqC family protein [Allomuricauda flava]SHG20134.1 WbqC-like protein family protein [Allomuricauda flava]
MSKILLHPCYFPSIATFSVLAQREVIWEAYDNFQKQTYRNRCYICTDQGRHMLNIPIKHVGGDEGRQKYRDVQPDTSTNWQRLHWRSLETAYRTSPFFEFYEDEIRPLFQQPSNNLLDFNLNSITTIADCLGISVSTEQTQKFEAKPKGIADGRFLVIAKSSLNLNSEVYPQVFEDRHGFIPNLSILDLLFNEGPNSLLYLRNMALDFLDA